MATRLVDAFGHGVRVAAGLPEREVLELLAVVERRALLEPGERRSMRSRSASMGARRRRAS